MARTNRRLYQKNVYHRNPTLLSSSTPRLNPKPPKNRHLPHHLKHRLHSPGFQKRYPPNHSLDMVSRLPRNNRRPNPPLPNQENPMAYHLPAPPPNALCNPYPHHSPLVFHLEHPTHPQHTPLLLQYQIRSFIPAHLTFRKTALIVHHDARK